MRDKEERRLVGDLGREALQAYRASVSFIDTQLGVVLDAEMRRLTFSSSLEGSP